MSILGSTPKRLGNTLTQSASKRALFNASSLTPLKFHICLLYDRCFLMGKFIYLFIYLEALIKQYITNIEQKNKKRDVFDKGQANGRGVPTRQTYIHTYIHTCIHAFIHSFIHTYIHTYIHAYIHSYIHTYIHTSFIYPRNA